MSKDFDTIVVPCKDREENQEMLSNGYWAAVRITECYRIIHPIEYWKEQDGSKCKIFFDKTSCHDLDIKYNKNNDPIMRASRYTIHNRLKNAKNLKELFCYS